MPKRLPMAATAKSTRPTTTSPKGGWDGSRLLLCASQRSLGLPCWQCRERCQNLGLGVIFIFAFLEVYSGVTLAHCYQAATVVLQRRPRMFCDLGYAAYGDRGSRWVQYGQYSYLWAFCVVVQYVAAKNLTYVLHTATGSGCLVVSHALVVLAVLPPLQFQTLTEVTKLACLGVVMIVLVLGLYFSQLGTKSASDTDTGVPETTSFADAMVQVMVIAFAFQGQGVYPEVQAEMRKPSDFVYSTILASVSLSAVYAGTGIFGYDVIGEKSPWLYTWDQKNHPHEIRTPTASAFLVVHVICGYVINASVVNQALAKQVLPKNPSRVQWFLMTLGTEASYFIVANVTPALSDLLSVAGATCGMLLMMGYPAVIGLKLKGRLGILPEWERRLHHFVLVFTVALMCLGMYASVIALKNANWAFRPFSCKA